MAIGDWTLYDGNGLTVYGFNGVEFPNSYQPSAWLVFNPAQISSDFEANYTPRSGEQFMISFCPADETAGTPAADHWLISPELPGIAQTISFYARALTTQYGSETFEVMASSTDNNPESFTKVASSEVATTEWSEFTVDLPAGTTYFAIRHTSQDIFGLLVDDVTFLVGGGSVASYNIYYEEELIANVSGEETTYTVAADAIENGERTFSISAVYASGMESKPVSVTIVVGEATAIDQVATDGQPVDIYSLDGKLVRQQAKSFNGLKGIYVINGKAVLVK